MSYWEGQVLCLQGQVLRGGPDHMHDKAELTHRTAKPMPQSSDFNTQRSGSMLIEPPSLTHTPASTPAVPGPTLYRSFFMMRH